MRVIASVYSLLGFLLVLGMLNEQTVGQELSGWASFRGANRSGHSDESLGAWSQPQLLWTAELPSAGIGGVAATSEFVVASSRNAADDQDVFTCFDAISGAELWKFSYDASTALDYGNSPRATPLIVDPYVVTLGATGVLRCVDIDSGDEVWERDLVKSFGGTMPDWGYTASPLHSAGRIVIQTGSPESNVVLLELASGKPQWRSTGGKSSYASPIEYSMEGSIYIVSYNEGDLVGYLRETGSQAWSIPKKLLPGFQVPTPIVERGLLITANEDRGVTLFKLPVNHAAQPKVVATSDAILSDMHSPVVVNGLLIGIDANGLGGLVGLDLHANLKEVWRLKDERLHGYGSLIALADGLIVVTEHAECLFVKFSDGKPHIEGEATFGFQERNMFAHPAFVDGVLYVRCQKSIQAWSLGAESPQK